MPRRSPRGLWDVHPDRLDLRKPSVLRWYVTRKILAGDWTALNRRALAQLLPSLRIDRNLKETLAAFLETPRTHARTNHAHRRSARGARRRR